MVSVHFTKNMRRHVDCPNEAAAGATVGEVLDDYFARHPAVRGYVLDEQGSVRRHVAVFLDGTQITDPARLSDPTGDDAEIYVMQALSGG
jgi:sulfur-carrier protein